MAQYKTCSGKAVNGFCDICFQPMMTTSIYCGRLIEVIAPSEEVKHFLLGKKIRYRYVDWEEGSFTPWSPCTERELKTILEDHSIEIVQFKP